jgi:hypothetical protein
MAKKKDDVVQNPNEIVFSKTKGFGQINYGAVTTKALFDENSISVERIGKILFFKGKPKIDVVEFGTIENVEVKTHFSKGDLISGIVLGLLVIIFAFVGEDAPNIYNVFVGLVIIAALLFCSYGKNIVITKKDSTKVGLLSEGIGAGEEIESFLKKLEEKGVAVQRGKK